MLKALAVALINKEHIETTEPKAKELRPFVERLVTIAREGTLAAHRNVVAHVGGVAGKKLITEIGPRYQTRQGGYTRIIKSGFRKGDSSPRAHIEFV